MIPKDPTRLVESFVKISTLPAIFAKLDEAINHPLMCLSEIAEIVSEDTGLSARLLRLANSPFYGFPSKIETVSQAIVLIGTAQLRDIALATSVISMFRGIPKETVTMESFWRHSICCGVAARTIATRLCEDNTERFFLGGILHDVGRLILFGKLPEQSRKFLSLADSYNTMLSDIEMETLGYTHATVGGLLLNFWKLPQSLQESTAYHHNPTAARQNPLETATMHIADIIAHSLEIGNNGERFVPMINNQAFEIVGIDINEYDSIIADTEKHTLAAIQSLMPYGDNCM